MTNQDVPKDKSVRFSIVLTIAKRDRLKEITSRYKVTQPEVIQVLLDRMIEEDIAPTLLKIREDKVKARSMVKNNVLLEKFRKLTPEQLTKLGEI